MEVVALHVVVEVVDGVLNVILGLVPRFAVVGIFAGLGIDVADGVGLGRGRKRQEKEEEEQYKDQTLSKSL